MIANYEAYLDGASLLGTVTVELPSLQSVTAEISGAGYGGTREVPVKGHFQNMTAKLTFRAPTKEARKILVQKDHHIELWSAIQNNDLSTGEYVITQQKVILRMCPIGVTLGSLTAGELQNVEMDFTVGYFRWFVDNKEICEVEPATMTCKIDGQDLLADIRGAIGL